MLHPKNGEIALPYSLAFATLDKEQSSRPHILQTSNEVFVFSHGEGEVFVDQEMTKVKAGDVIHIPAGAKQYVKNIGPETLKFWCIVSPPWSKSDELVV